MFVLLLETVSGLLRESRRRTLAERDLRSASETCGSGGAVTPRLQAIGRDTLVPSRQLRLSQPATTATAGFSMRLSAREVSMERFIVTLQRPSASA